MVDRVDKPDRTTSYGVKGPTETKKEKPREEHRQEDLPTFKQKEHSVYEEKFQSGSAPLKTVRVPLDRIQKMIFRRAVPFHGNPMAEADLIWKDGRATESVTFLLRNWQDFLKIKNLKSGETLDPAYWSSPSGHLEVTLWKKTTTSGSWNLRELQTPKTEPAAAPKKWWWKKWWLERHVVTGLAVVGGVLLLTLLIIWIAS